MKKLFSILLCINMLLLTGCRKNYTEVRDRAYVQSAFFMDNGNISLALFPFEEEKEVSYGSGVNISEALENSEVSAGREIFMGHLELLCFDNADFTDEFQSCLLDYRITPSCHVLYIQGSQLSEESDVMLLTDRLLMEEEKGHMPKTDLFHVLSEIKSADNAALVPVLTNKKLAMCILKKGSKPYILSERSTEGLCWLRGENYPEKVYISGNNGSEAFEIDSARTDISVRIEEGIPCATVKIRIKGKGNSQAAESVITALCKDAVNETLKRAKSDVIGFGKYLARDCPSFYAENDFETEKWAAVFEYDVRAE